MDDADSVSFVSIDDREDGPGEVNYNKETKILDSHYSLAVTPLESRDSLTVNTSPNTPNHEYRTSLNITSNENLLDQKSDMMTKSLILGPSSASPSKFINSMSQNQNADVTNLENSRDFDSSKIETNPLQDSPKTFQFNFQPPLQSNSLIHYFTTLSEGRAALHGIKPKSRNIGTLILKQENDQIPESHTGWKPLFPSPKIFKSLTERVSKRSFFSVKSPLITESAKLENSVFSPKTHRPSVVDFPTIETIEDVYRANHSVCSYFATIFSKTNSTSPIPSCLRQLGRKGSHRSPYKPLQVKFDLPPQSEYHVRL